MHIRVITHATRLGTLSYGRFDKPGIPSRLLDLVMNPSVYRRIALLEYKAQHHVSFQKCHNRRQCSPSLLGTKRSVSIRSLQCDVQVRKRLRNIPYVDTLQACPQLMLYVIQVEELNVDAHMRVLLRGLR